MRLPSGGYNHAFTRRCDIILGSEPSKYNHCHAYGLPLDHVKDAVMPGGKIQILIDRLANGARDAWPERSRASCIASARQEKGREGITACPATASRASVRSRFSGGRPAARARRVIAPSAFLR